jgi:hypothetical protein
LLFAGSEKPHAELNVDEVHDTELCALLVFSFLFYSPFFTPLRPSVLSLRHLLHVDTGNISTPWMLCIGLILAKVRILKIFRTDAYGGVVLFTAYGEIHDFVISQATLLS